MSVNEVKEGEIVPKLTLNDLELLTYIYKFGGYCRVSFLKYIYPSLKYHSHLKKLTALVNKGYLSERRYTTASKMEAKTYICSHKTYKYFNDVNRHIRKTEILEKAKRTMIRSEFLFANNINKNALITVNSEKMELLCKKKFDVSYLPALKNQSISFRNLEEMVIDLSKITKPIKIYGSKSIKCDDRLLLLFPDKTHSKINTVITSFYTRIKPLIEYGGNVNMDVIFLSDRKERVEEFNEYIEKIPFSFNLDHIIEKFINEYRLHTRDFISDDKVKEKALNIDLPPEILINELKGKVLKYRSDVFENYKRYGKGTKSVSEIYLLVLNLLIRNEIEYIDTTFYAYSCEKPLFNRY